MEIELYAPGPTGIPEKDAKNEPNFIYRTIGNPLFYMWAKLTLTNHRTDRKETLRDASLHLKKKHWVFWQKTIFKATVYRDIEGRGVKNEPLRNITIEPLAPPVEVIVIAEDFISIPIHRLPKRLGIFLEFNMVGPRRYFKKYIDDAIYDSAFPSN